MYFFSERNSYSRYILTFKGDLVIILQHISVSNAKQVININLKGWVLPPSESALVKNVFKI